MRRTTTVVSVSLLSAAMLVLTACSSDDGAAPVSSSASAPSSSGSPATSGTSGTPTPSSATPSTTPTNTVPLSELPTINGAAGTKPTISFPDNAPPTTLQTVVLTEGTGPVVETGDLLLANYLGQIWGGKVFDNSYDRGEPAGFPIGTGGVIPGWDKGLVGQKVGSRIMLVIPPADGYGSDGNSQAGITGTDTLVFEVTIVDAYGKDSAGQADATPEQLPADGPQVQGALGGPATVTIPAGATQPTKITTTVVAKGTGAPVKAGTAIVQYAVSQWDGKSIGSTWTQGSPQAVPVGTTGDVFDGLAGIPVGSRVLIAVPADPTQEQPSLAAVVDIVAQG